ncbi:MAG TPA: HD domain-containing protein, partial [Desulfotomaculum sp.]|nr:HD domain-containing protein [Desulfotomaculum sp.]
MQRVGRILADDFYRFCLAQNATREVDRPFCRHDFQHMLDVARISYILLVESNQLADFIRRYRLKNRQAAREVVYAAGLLHDMGRWQQYDHGEDHALAGARL